jgi:hypothetical protein
LHLPVNKLQRDSSYHDGSVSLFKKPFMRVSSVR